MDSWVVSRKYQGNMAAGKGSHARQGGSANVKGTMEVFPRGCTPFTFYCIPDQEGVRERGICIGTYAYIYICVCVFWKEVFLFVCLKRRFNHSYSKHRSYGPRPWSILLLVSFQRMLL